MDVIGNNISNVNTIGFKTSRVVFQDIYSQTASAASAPTANSGGTNGIQIGLGMKVSTIDNLHTSASTQRTDNPLDAAIEGEGFFVLDITGTKGYKYTRAGNFYLDADDNLVSANGAFVMGINSGITNDPTTGAPTNTGLPATVDFTNPNNLQHIKIAKGYSDVSIDSDGVIWGVNDFTQTKEVLGRIALATFSNNAGLEKAGSSMYGNTSNSGPAMYGYANTGGAGKLNPGGLEMSNVDLASEMTDMIITQRGFQANSRVITTSDTLLEELVNLKRS